eukprot:PhF_6_TR39616/c0_g1_i4/m.58695
MFTDTISDFFQTVGSHIHTPRQIQFPPYLHDTIGRTINAQINGAMLAYGTTLVAGTTGLYLSWKIPNHRRSLQFTGLTATIIVSSELFSSASDLYYKWLSSGPRLHSLTCGVIAHRMELYRNTPTGSPERIVAKKLLMELYDTRVRLTEVLQHYNVPEEEVKTVVQSITTAATW